jgi:hypothetical protein
MLMHLFFTGLQDSESALDALATPVASVAGISSNPTRVAGKALGRGKSFSSCIVSFALLNLFRSTSTETAEAQLVPIRICGGNEQLFDRRRLSKPDQSRGKTFLTNHVRVLMIQQIASFVCEQSARALVGRCADIAPRCRFGILSGNVCQSCTARLETRVVKFDRTFPRSFERSLHSRRMRRAARQRLGTFSSVSWVKFAQKK